MKDLGYNEKGILSPIEDEEAVMLNHEEKKEGEERVLSKKENDALMFE